MSDLLQRARDALLYEHEDLYLEMGDPISEESEYHTDGPCVICDLLRELDKALQTGNICDCHP